MAEVFIKKRPLIGFDTKLCDIPRAWLELIEPKISRPEGSSCWIWDGAVNQHAEPVRRSKNLAKGESGNIALKYVVARMFWEIDEHTMIYHECGNNNCLAPFHFYLTNHHHKQSDIKRILREKQLRIARYGSKGQ